MRTKDPRAIKMLQKENLGYPEHLINIPSEKWPPVNLPQGLKEVWRSRYYLVQVFGEKDGIERLSINISDVDTKSSRWRDGISWDELQVIKRQVGRGHKDAVEIFPNDADIVNVANIRHIWILPEPLPYAWRKKTESKDEQSK